MSGLEDRDWSLMEATRESLIEHMAIAREYKKRAEAAEQTVKELCEAICIFAREELGNMNFESDQEVIAYMMSFRDIAFK